MSAVNGAAAPVPEKYQNLGYGSSSAPKGSQLGAANAIDNATPVNPIDPSPLSQSAAQGGYGRFNEEWEMSQRGSSILDGPAMHRSNSFKSQGGGATTDDSLLPTRGGTLKKKASMKRSSSLRRSGSRRSSRAGSVRSLALQSSGDIDEMQSAFFSPVPTTGNPTEILANRFQVWRKVLKDLITYFKEIQLSYEHKAKNVLKVANVVNNTTSPSFLLKTGGIDDALQILRGYHKNVIAEANKAKEIETDVILALTGLRSDLSQKIKEIKNLSGDFKNSVDKEMEKTQKAVNELQDGLGQSEVDPAQMTGKQDPYLLKLAVDRQVEKQIDEENYLHQAYLNLEHSGRELEQIVVGEIQKSYNALAGILRREADGSYEAIEELRTGPIAMPKDHEWNAFIAKDDYFVDPNVPIRQAQYIHYPGRDNELAQEVRAGLLERKSKYLKSYTAGWYVLSPTHLHEFKSADKTQAPIMSLYLAEQKLGSHSNNGGSSNKFMLKGRQTGSMHRGHSWVFRAESYETMMAWYNDLQALTEKTPQERNAYVRQHARSLSNASQKAGSISSDGMLEEEDDEPFLASASSTVMAQEPKQDARRPAPGGRFPSTDLIVNPTRGLQVPLSPSSGSSILGDTQDRDVIVATGNQPDHYAEEYRPSSPTHVAKINQLAQEDGVNPYTALPLGATKPQQDTHCSAGQITGAALGGAGLGTVASEAYHNQEETNAPSQNDPQQHEAVAAQESSTISAPDTNDHQAALEASIISAPDVISSPFSESNAMSGGRGPGALNNQTIHASDFSVARPPTETHQSNFSISQLHVPGEYPKSSGKGN